MTGKLRKYLTVSTIVFLIAIIGINTFKNPNCSGVESYNQHLIEEHYSGDGCQIWSIPYHDYLVVNHIAFELIAIIIMLLFFVFLVCGWVFYLIHQNKKRQT